jgi:hypothetical protein
VFFFNIGGAALAVGFRCSRRPRSATFSSRCSARRRPSQGFKLVDGRASYGIGLETFALGFPIHFDWSWRTLFNR